MICNYVEHPHPHLVIDQIVAPDVYESMRFPDALVAADAWGITSSDPEYALVLRDPAWKLLHDELTGDEFVGKVLSCFGADMRQANCLVDPDLAALGPSSSPESRKGFRCSRPTTIRTSCSRDSISSRRAPGEYREFVHLDWARRIVGGILFFSDAAEEGLEGGELALYRDRGFRNDRWCHDPELIALFPPRANSGVIFLNSNAGFPWSSPDHRSHRQAPLAVLRPGGVSPQPTPATSLAVKPRLRATMPAGSPGRGALPGRGGPTDDVTLLFRIRPATPNIGNDAIGAATSELLRSVLGAGTNIVDLPAHATSGGLGGLTARQVYDMNRSADGVVIGGGNLFENGQLDARRAGRRRAPRPAPADRALTRADPRPRRALVDRTDAMAADRDPPPGTEGDRNARARPQLAGDASLPRRRQGRGRRVPDAVPRPQSERRPPTTDGCCVSVRHPGRMSVPPPVQWRVADDVRRLIAAARSEHGDSVFVVCHDYADIEFARGFPETPLLYFDDAREYFEALRRCRLSLTYRLHAFLPCLAFGTPSVHVSYDERGREAVATAGMGDWDIDLLRERDVVEAVMARARNLDRVRRASQPSLHDRCRPPTDDGGGHRALCRGGRGLERPTVATLRAVDRTDLHRPPRVTVVMPVYNAGDFVSEAVESVLAQTFDELELIAVDDGSSDDSRSILERYARLDSRVRVVRNETNLGLVPATNLGCRLSRSEYIARLDADDVALPDRLASQVEFLDSHPSVAAVGGAAISIDPSGRQISVLRLPSSSAAIRARMPKRCCFIHSSVTMRRDAFEAVGGYRFGPGGGYDLWLRLSERFDLANLPQPVVRYRVHADRARSSRSRSSSETSSRFRPPHARASRRAGIRWTASSD